MFSWHVCDSFDYWPYIMRQSNFWSLPRVNFESKYQNPNLYFGEKKLEFLVAFKIFQVVLIGHPQWLWSAVSGVMQCKSNAMAFMWNDGNRFGMDSFTFITNLWHCLALNRITIVSVSFTLIAYCWVAVPPRFCKAFSRYASIVFVHPQQPADKTRLVTEIAMEMTKLKPSVSFFLVK